MGEALEDEGKPLYVAVTENICQKVGTIDKAEVRDKLIKQGMDFAFTEGRKQGFSEAVKIRERE